MDLLDGGPRQSPANLGAPGSSGRVERPTCTSACHQGATVPYVSVVICCPHPSILQHIQIQDDAFAVQTCGTLKLKAGTKMKKRWQNDKNGAFCNFLKLFTQADVTMWSPVSLSLPTLLLLHHPPHKSARRGQSATDRAGTL